MDLLSILIEERDLKWVKSTAECAERFTAQGARRSSGFQLALGDLLIQEIEERCSLYLKHNGNLINFDEFFKTQKTSLLSGLKNRFGGCGLSEEECDLLQKKYRAIMFSDRSPAPKPRIGFNC